MLEWIEYGFIVAIIATVAINVVILIGLTRAVVHDQTTENER